MKELSKKHNVAKNTFFYTTCRYFAQAVNFVTATLISRFLGPFNVGIWNLLKVVRDYAVFTDLGTSLTVSYKFPFLSGKGEITESEKLKNTVFTFTILSTVLSSLFIGLYVLIFRSALRQGLLIGLIVVSVLLFFQRLYTYYIVLLRANKNFGILSRSVIFDALVDLCLVLIFVTKLKLYGLYIIVIVLPILNTLYISYYVKFKLRLTFRMPNIISYIKFGLPLFLVSILKNILNSIDKIMISAMLGIEQLGFYSIALMTKNYTEDISKNFGHILNPYLFEDYGKHDSIPKATKQVMTITLVVAYFMAFFLSLVFICAPAFIKIALPKFVPGIGALKIFLLAIFFTSVSEYLTSYFVVLNKQARLFPIISAAIFLNIILNYISIKMKFGINGVSASSAISASLSFFIMAIYSLKHANNSLPIAKAMAKIIFPLFYSSLIILLIEYKIELINPVLDSLVKGLVFILCFLPILILLNKETKIMQIIFELLYNRRALK